MKIMLMTKSSGFPSNKKMKIACNGYDIYRNKYKFIFFPCEFLFLLYSFLPICIFEYDKNIQNKLTLNF